MVSLFFVCVCVRLCVYVCATSHQGGALYFRYQTSKLDHLDDPNYYYFRNNLAEVWPDDATGVASITITSKTRVYPGELVPMWVDIVDSFNQSVPPHVLSVTSAFPDKSVRDRRKMGI